MRNFILKLLLSIFLFSIGNYAFAKVYSTIVKIEVVNGYDDCWKITYELWEDHNDLNPANDTKLGRYNALIGPCTEEENLINNTDLSKDPFVIDFNVFLLPNPANEYLEIIIDNAEYANSVNWFIFDINGSKIMNGELNSENFGNFTERIDIGYLNNGIYLFGLPVDDKILIKKFIINK